MRFCSPGYGELCPIVAAVNVAGLLNESTLPTNRNGEIIKPLGKQQSDPVAENIDIAILFVRAGLAINPLRHSKVKLVRKKAGLLDFKTRISVPLDEFHFGGEWNELLCFPPIWGFQSDGWVPDKPVIDITV